MGSGTEEDAWGCRLQGLGDGVKVLSGELGEAGAEVSGLGRGGGGGVTAGCVEQVDGGEGEDGGEVDLSQEFARGPNEGGVGAVFVEAWVHAEDGEDWSCG